MDQDTRTAGAQVAGGGGETRSPEEIRADIDQTRDEVGDTVEALAAKTDVKARVRQRVDEVKANARAKADELKGKAQQATPATAQQAGGTAVAKARENPMPLIAGAALLAAFLIGRRTAHP